MNKVVVGVGDFKVSGNQNDVIVTHALGSCLGITAYDPVVNVGGMVHVMLPLSKADKVKAQKRPSMYVDTGLGILLKKVFELGASKNNLKIMVAGGASMKKSSGQDHFKIGKRNFTTLRKLLWKNGYMIEAQDVGGTKFRTMALSIVDGQVLINKQPISGGTMNAGRIPVNQNSGGVYRAGVNY